MQLRNASDSWGLVSISLHWVVAISVISLFALGLWMTSLSYYDDWYRQAPHLHKSIGLIVASLMLIRLVWRLFDSTPLPLGSHKPYEIRAAHLVHTLIYLLLFAIFISGYLISTADGRPIEVFDWFQVPALIQGVPGQEDIAGKVHYYLAITLISLVVIHAMGALKHHFIDRDETLKRMLGKGIGKHSDTQPL